MRVRRDRLQEREKRCHCGEYAALLILKSLDGVHLGLQSLGVCLIELGSRVRHICAELVVVEVILSGWRPIVGQVR